MIFDEAHEIEDVASNYFGLSVSNLRNDKYKLIEAIDPNWQGALPYTVVTEPGGKIVYAKEGAVNVAELKKLIVDNRFIGRYY